MTHLFRDRRHAGRQLASRLGDYQGGDVVVLALPRGGVPIGREIADRLGAQLDLILVRKLGAPSQPELAVGAVAEGDPPELVLNESLVRRLSLSSTWLAEQQAAALLELSRRRKAYVETTDRISVRGKTALVVDDGVATGATMRAALRALRRQEPKRLVLALPVAAPDTLAELEKEVDEVVCLSSPWSFRAVGESYADFSQLSDDDVRDLLRSSSEQESHPKDVND